MLARQGGDPNVVGRQWLSGFLQLLPKLMRSAWQSPPLSEARYRMHGRAPAMLHIRADDGK
jgi:hypothetical protein